MSRTSITEETLNYSNKNLHVKQDQNWISKSFRKLSIASSTPPNLSSLNLNVKPETNIPEVIYKYYYYYYYYYYYCYYNSVINMFIII